MFSELISSIARAFTKKERDRAITFSQLARDAADGKKIDVDKGADILRQAGKTPDDLRLAVERIQKRRALIATVKAAAGVSVNRTELQKLSAAADAKRDAAIREHETTMAPLRVQWAECDRLEREANKAKGLLHGDVGDETQAQMEAFEPRLKELQGELASLWPAIAAANAALIRAQEVARDPQGHQRGMAEIPFNDRAGVAKERLLAAEQGKTEIDSKAAAIQGEIKAIQDEREAIQDNAAMIAA